MLGKTIGHYEILSLIGRGGMGEVYRARDTKLDRDVAIKVLPADLASDPTRLDRFLREAKTVAALNHPHIVTIHSVEEEHGVRFLTMELVEGQTLDHMITQAGLPLSRVFEIGIAVADALSAAHERGIVHRDLKPANVIIAADGRAKVLDFGLAKLAALDAASEEAVTRTSPITTEGQVMGTVPYMSPEQLRGQVVDQRSDIFSLGILLYELSTGQRPFSGPTNADISSAILSSTPPPVTQLKPDMPTHLGRIVSHCLEKDPDQRFQSAKDVRNELRSLRKEVESGFSEATSASHSALSHPPRRGGSKKKLWLGLAAVVLAIGAVVFLTGRGSHDAPPDATMTANATASLAVLPFVNMSSDKEQEYFSDGLTEELMNALSKIPDLKVAARTSSFSFKGRNEDLREVAKELGVANILEGSVRKSGKMVRITAQLVKAEDGFHLWSQTYDRTLDDIFAVQDDIAKSVAEELEVTLLGQTSINPNAEAYDLILQARYTMSAPSVDTIRRARTLLDEALNIAPDYAPAWAEMGLLHLRESEIATSVEKKHEASRLTRDALLHALDLDPKLAVAHSRMAIVHSYEWKFNDAARETELAVAAEPKNPVVLINAGLIYLFTGRRDKAMAVYEQLIDIDPLNPRNPQSLSVVYMLAGRLDDAEKTLERVLISHPDYEPLLYSAFTVSLLKSDKKEARIRLDRWQSVISDEWNRLYGAALFEAMGGKQGPTTSMDQFEKSFPDDPFSIATIEALRGDNDAAFKQLDRALAARDPNLSGVWSEVLFRGLHSDSRWGALLKKIGLPTVSS